VKDSFCSWINGGWDGTVVGLSNLDGNDASENDTSTIRDFVKGRWYAFRLAVTESRIQADRRQYCDRCRHHPAAGRLRFDESDLCKPWGFPRTPPSPDCEKSSAGVLLPNPKNSCIIQFGKQKETNEPALFHDEHGGSYRDPGSPREPQSE
jgi:hypothetical protein